MILSLERLGRSAEAARLEKHFENFAETERDSKDPLHRSEARYLLGLIKQHDGLKQEAHTLLKEALDARPDLLAARLDLRGDVIAPESTNTP